MNQYSKIFNMGLNCLFYNKKLDDYSDWESKIDKKEVKIIYIENYNKFSIFKALDKICNLAEYEKINSIGILFDFNEFWVNNKDLIFNINGLEADFNITSALINSCIKELAEYFENYKELKINRKLLKNIEQLEKVNLTIISFQSELNQQTITDANIDFSEYSKSNDNNDKAAVHLRMIFNIYSDLAVNELSNFFDAIKVKKINY